MYQLGRPYFVDSRLGWPRDASYHRCAVIVKIMRELGHWKNKTQIIGMKKDTHKDKVDSKVGVT